MTEIKDEVFLKAVHTPAEGLELLGKVVEAASPRAVFGEPIQQGDTTLITASRVRVGLGFGLVGFVLGRKETNQGDDRQERNEVNGGGGGGGSTLARPVAVISVTSKGVEVKPILDVTRIILAFLSTIGAIFIAHKKMKHIAE